MGYARLAGLVCATVVLGIAELVAVPVGADSAPLSALGGFVIDHVPDGPREWAIQTFGTLDKPVLLLLMLAVAAVLAGLAGQLEKSRPPIGSAVFAGLALVAAAAAVSRPDANWTYAVPVLVGLVAGLAVLRWLLRRPAAETATGDRRAFLVAGGLAVGAGLMGRWLGARARDVGAERAAVQLPAPADPAPPLPDGVDLRIANLATYITPNDKFYRIDTTFFSSPQLSTADWELRIHGMVAREVRLTWADLARRRPVERLVTLACVSNEIGGDLVGNARWLGYPVRELLAEAGPQPDADMVLSRSIDNFTAGTPLEALTDARDALLAIGMNGEPLPVPHGFPARLVVPGLYGYVSATKWVVDLEVTRFDRAQAYWTRRGWSERGPIKTATRIDTPRTNTKLEPGRVAVAGVAWAQTRGIAAVEIQIDNGAWRPARLAADYSADTWRQWVYEWDAEPGPHVLRARAIDGTGALQIQTPQGVLPDGATGWQEISVRVG